jgi:hypothetical protein
MDLAVTAGDDDLSSVDIGAIFLDALPMLEAFQAYCTKQVRKTILRSVFFSHKKNVKLFSTPCSWGFCNILVPYTIDENLALTRIVRTQSVSTVGLNFKIVVEMFAEIVPVCLMLETRYGKFNSIIYLQYICRTSLTACRFWLNSTSMPFLKKT